MHVLSNTGFEDGCETYVKSKFLQIHFLVARWSGIIDILLLLEKLSMSREHFLDELSDDFPPRTIYSYDETARYNAERLALIDAVLDGSFEKYECKVKDSEFSYKITADAVFDLEVVYKDESWKKSFSYVTEAFEIAESAYRFFVVVPRVLDEGEVLLANEKNYPVDAESRQMHDHCDDEPVEVFHTPELDFKGQYIHAKVFRCLDSTYLLTIVHVSSEKGMQPLLDRYYGDVELAKLLAVGYLNLFDRAEYPIRMHETYKKVYIRVTH